MITWQDFEKVEIRTGTVISAEDFPEAKNPAYKLTVDFGSYGIKKSSAQITKLYGKKELVGKQVIAVVNFPPKQIANFVSECLVLGVVMENKEIVLLQPERKVADGYRIA
ncbi:tRNA-binding protein [Candidatus Woesearchaeota archaeon]|nr:tRNA-binding protein [Candidatus Woesearchaeota archaeon]